MSFRSTKNRTPVSTHDSKIISSSVSNSQSRAPSKEATDRTSQSPNPAKLAEESEEEEEKSRSTPSKKDRSAKMKASSRNATPDGAGPSSNPGRRVLRNPGKVAEESEEEDEKSRFTLSTKGRSAKLKASSRNATPDEAGPSSSSGQRNLENPEEEEKKSRSMKDSSAKLRAPSRNANPERASQSRSKLGKRPASTLSDTECENLDKKKPKKSVFQDPVFNDFFSKDFSLAAPNRTNNTS
jgi:hypothetical protein